MTDVSNSVQIDSDDEYIVDLFKKRSALLKESDKKSDKDSGSVEIISDSKLVQELKSIFTQDQISNYSREDVFFSNPDADTDDMDDDTEEDDDASDPDASKASDASDTKSESDEEASFDVTKFNLLKICQYNNPTIPGAVSAQSAFQKQFKALFQNPELSDVCFLVRDATTDEWKEIYGHKLILRTRSHYFRNMFSSGMAEAVGEKVKIDFVPYDIFLNLLEYLYTGILKITYEKVLLLLAAANQFQMQDVKEIISQFLSRTIDFNNACFLFEQSFFHNSQELRDVCLTCIEENPERIINSLAFQSMTREMIIEIIKSDHLVIDEFQLFKACILWAKAQAKAEGRDPENDCAEYFSQIVEYIRFPLMKPKELKDEIEKNYRHLVPPKYILEAYKKHAQPGSVNTLRARLRHARMRFKLSQTRKSHDVIVTNSQLTAHISSSGPHSICGDVEWKEGLHYFEVTIDATETPRSNIMIGVSDPSVTPMKSFLSHHARGWGIYAHSGEKYHNSSSRTYGSPMGKGTVVGCLVNLTSGEIRFIVDGVDLGVAYSNVTAPVSPCITLYHLHDQVTINPTPRTVI